jgi:hypothetical protein
MPYAGFKLTISASKQSRSTPQTTWSLGLAGFYCENEIDNRMFGSLDLTVVIA